MSLHKSLKQSNTLQRRRNVLTREERIQKLEEEGRWDEEEDSVFGLAKVKLETIERPSASKEEEEEAAPEEEAEALEGEETAEEEAVEEEL